MLSDCLVLRITTHPGEGFLDHMINLVEGATRSGSGLDPHISPTNAAVQTGRVARARDLPLARIHALIAQHTTPPDWGILGQPQVNVLLLNLALDALPR